MRHALGMCFNWKVLAVLAAAGALLFLLAPGFALAALPLLLLAVCPLSMLLMAFAMRGSMSANDRDDVSTPSVERDQPAPVASGQPRSDARR
jgi:hypothetical protein